MKNIWSSPNSPEDRTPIWWLRWVPTIAVAFLVLYLLYITSSVAIIPVLVSVALAYLLNPVVRQLENRGLSRPASAAAAILVVSLIIAAFLAYVVPELWAETTKAGAKIASNFTPENAERQRAVLKRFSPALERVAGDKIEKFLSDPMPVIASATTTTTKTADGTEVTTGGQSIVWTTIVSSLDLLLVPFFVFYILIDFGKWRDSLEELIPQRFREPFRRLFDESGRILESFVRGQLFIGLIMAAFYGLGFWFLGVPAWAGLALIAGLLNVIPYFGTLFGMVLAGAFTLANGGGVWDIAAVVGVFVAVQTLEGYVLTPKILGGRLNLHPMAVFLGLLIGGKLFGILGFILAIPAIAIGKVFFKFLRELYMASHFYHAGDIHPMDVPSENIEERIADAAAAVLAEQESNEVKEGSKDPAEADEAGAGRHSSG